ncbi:restriction endonuclease subunit S [Bacteroides ovatus]|uniref:restriction endonuclease subunit S n=1 Tax=Bacteroides ovatus TaxID=28116 RepID=UPI001F1BA048|nr:restriction endonuclease subunit S [Bacteroides ovatus]MCE8747108.1 restriction endonuclease subunit S [Bacteroides ovatus]
MKLKKYKLYEIADLNKSSISNSDNTLSEIIYLDTSSITENVILGTCKMSIHEAPSRAQRRVKKNTILYSTVRPRLKHYGILSSPEANLIVSTGFVTIDVKSEFHNSVDARFLFLLLTQPHITEYMASIADSAVSAYPSFNPSDISALEFEFPEMNIQTHIADIWEYYDSKIELNRQINDNLPMLDRSSREGEAHRAA